MSTFNTNEIITTQAITYRIFNVFQKVDFQQIASDLISKTWDKDDCEVEITLPEIQMVRTLASDNNMAASVGTYLANIQIHFQKYLATRQQMSCQLEIAIAWIGASCVFVFRCRLFPVFQEQSEFFLGYKGSMYIERFAVKVDASWQVSWTMEEELGID